MIVTALLVRYTGGLHWVENATGISTYGRREGYLTLDVNSVEEVERICTALFVEKAHPQITTSAQIEPTGTGDNPFTDFALSDWVNAPDEAGAPESVRVRGLGIEEDGDGNLTYPIIVRSAILEFEDRVARWLKRMANGTLSGSVQSAGPVSSIESGSKAGGEDGAETIEFSVVGDMEVRTSGKYTVLLGGHISTIFESNDVGTGDTEFDILLNGSPIGSGVVIDDAVTSQSDDFDEVAAPGDKLQLDITAAGMHPEAVVQVVMTP